MANTKSPLGRGAGTIAERRQAAKQAKAAPVRDLPAEDAEELLRQGDAAPDEVQEEPEEDANAGLLDESSPDPEEDEEDGVGAPRKPKKKETTEPPAWAVLPQGLRLPRKGTKVTFMRIPAAWTPDPQKGDRWCACWPLTETEERLAYGRSRGDTVRSTSELSKQTIRVVDGFRVTWAANGAPGDVRQFWAEIGPKGRQIIRNYYVRTHTLQEAEILDFFSRHFVPMTVT